MKRGGQQMNWGDLEQSDPKPESKFSVVVEMPHWVKQTNGLIKNFGVILYSFWVKILKKYFSFYPLLQET